MLQIQIDGKQIEVKQGATIIEAAHQLGTYIPHFCYHKKLSIAASCRMCLVEVEKAPKPLPACATPVTDGMVVHTHSEKVKQAQQSVMEFLLINHPLDCPLCDQGGECQLQDLAVGYGKSGSRYAEEKRTVVGKQMGPLISAEEMSRCIHCTRCVRFTEEIAGLQEIGMANRSNASQIMPFIGKTVQSELSGNVIDLCPVGALTSKPFRYSARAWELSRRKSISAHDSLGANLIVQTKDHTVRRVLPLENEAINECWISDRDRFAYEGLYQNRLLTPKIKQDGKWHEVDWNTALDYVQRTLNSIIAEHGKDSLAAWVNPMNTVEEMYLSKKFLNGLGSQCISARLKEQDNRLSGSLKGAEWLGQSIEQLAECQAILIVGANLRKEQPVLTARLRRAAKNGTALSVIAASQEALHMPLLAQESIHPNQWTTYLNNLPERLSGSLKEAQRAAILLGADAQNHPDYAAIYAAAEQLAKDTNAILGVLPQAANSVGADVLAINQATITDLIAALPKAVLLMNVEPECDVVGGQAAVAALKQAESVMAFTAYESETLNEVADILLPIAPFTETSGSFINMEGRLQSFHGVVKGLGDSRPLWKILRVLGNVFQLSGFEFNSSQEVLSEAIADEHTLLSQLNNETIATFEAKTPTKSLIRVGGVAIYESDPIVRRAVSLQQTTHAATPVAELNKQTLTQLGLVAGDVVDAKQNQATVRVMVAENNALPDDVVYLPHHRSNAALGGLMNVIELTRA